MAYINIVIVVIQNDQDAYPELDLDDVMKIDESSREEKLAVRDIYYTHTHNVHTPLFYKCIAGMFGGKKYDRLR